MPRIKLIEISKLSIDFINWASNIGHTKTEKWINKDIRREYIDVIKFSTLTNFFSQIDNKLGK